MKKIHFGHWLQIIWIIMGAILQIWIGGIKGFVVMITGIILFCINSILIQIKCEAQKGQKRLK